MLSASTHGPSRMLLHAYANWRLRRAFHAVELSGDTRPLDKDESYPLLLFCNHTSWWDGFLKIPLFQRYRMDYYVMMEEKNLARFPFFRRAGAFGVNLNDPAGRRGSLLYAARLLRNAGAGRRALVVYPHGRLVGAHEAPPSFRPGVEGLIRLVSRGHAVPVGLMIRFDKFPLPVARIHLGNAIPFEAHPAGEHLERALAEAVRAAIGAGPAGDYLLPPKRFFHGRT